MLKTIAHGYRLAITAGLFLLRGVLFLVMFLLQLTVGGADVRPQDS